MIKKERQRAYLQIFFKNEEKELLRYISAKLGLSMCSFIRASALKKARQENFILNESKINAKKYLPPREEM